MTTRAISEPMQGGMSRRADVLTFRRHAPELDGEALVVSDVTRFLVALRPGGVSGPYECVITGVSESHRISEELVKACAERRGSYSAEARDRLAAGGVHDD